jgi:hypothetical protein
MNDDIKVESITDHEDGSATLTLNHVRSNVP